MIFLSCLITWFYNKLDFDVVFEAYLNRCYYALIKDKHIGKRR